MRTKDDVMKVIKLDERAKVPVRHSEGAAGYDLSVLNGGKIAPKEVVKVRTGLIFMIPEKCLGIVFGRSGLALKNGIEVLDTKLLPGNKHELIVTLMNTGKEVFEYEAGFRIAQLVLVEISDPNILEVDNLEDSKRGESGFGSTGML